MPPRYPTGYAVNEDKQGQLPETKASRRRFVKSLGTTPFNFQSFTMNQILADIDVLSRFPSSNNMRRPALRAL